jgi:hypothetical protein
MGPTRERTESRARIRAGIAILAALSASLSACAVGDSTHEAQVRSGRTSEALLGICQPLTCCFPSGGNWSQNPFEDGLRALGCATPEAYTESYTQSDWWLYSRCPPSVGLVTLVAQYAAVSPYYSQLVVNECLELHSVLGSDPTDVFVEWDPTCSSCSWE